MVILPFITDVLQEEAMGKKRLNAEEIIVRLRQAEVLLSQGRELDLVLREIGATRNTFYTDGARNMAV